MVSPLKKYKVENTSDRYIERGGQVLPPKSIVEVEVPLYTLKEFTSCTNLKVEEIVEKKQARTTSKKKTITKTTKGQKSGDE